jgi:hypothetical protein
MSSYRVDTDKDLAEAMCHKLEEHTIALTKDQQLQVRVFWDAKDISDGSNWKLVFLQAVKHSCLFVPIVSEAAIAPMAQVLPTNSKPDNVLLEYETAIQQQRNGLTAILPIFVGARSGPHERIPRFNFELFGSHTFPSTGSVTQPTVPVRDTMTAIFANQGLFLSHVLENGDMFCHPKLGATSEATSVAGRVVQTLEDVAWYNPSNPHAIQGRKYWSHKKPSGSSRADVMMTNLAAGRHGNDDGLRQQLLSDV